MDKKQFARLRTLYNILMFIAETRYNLLKEMISYVDDSLRYQRRMRFLVQLSQYEHQLLTKFQNLDDDDSHFSEELIQHIKDEILIIVDHSS